jgi:hypothetical protein
VKFEVVRLFLLLFKHGTPDVHTLVDGLAEAAIPRTSHHYLVVPRLPSFPCAAPAAAASVASMLG